MSLAFALTRGNIKIRVRQLFIRNIVAAHQPSFSKTFRTTLQQLVKTPQYKNASYEERREILMKSAPKDPAPRNDTLKIRNVSIHTTLSEIKEYLDVFHAIDVRVAAVGLIEAKFKSIEDSEAAFQKINTEPGYPWRPGTTTKNFNPVLAEFWKPGHKILPNPRLYISDFPGTETDLRNIFLPFLPESYILPVESYVGFAHGVRRCYTTVELPNVQVATAAQKALNATDVSLGDKTVKLNISFAVQYKPRLTTRPFATHQKWSQLQRRER